MPNATDDIERSHQFGGAMTLVLELASTQSSRSWWPIRMDPLLGLDPGLLVNRQHERVDSGQVLAESIESNNAPTFIAFLETIDAAIDPSLDIHVVLDNGSSHREPGFRQLGPTPPTHCPCSRASRGTSELSRTVRTSSLSPTSTNVIRMRPEVRVVPRIGLLVVAVDTVDALVAMLERLPEGFRQRVDEVMVCEVVAEPTGWWRGGPHPQLDAHNVVLIDDVEHQGYGAKLKAGYQRVIDEGFDIVVVIRGDGRYAPEVAEHLVEPLELHGADVALGSRMTSTTVTRPGGPLVKYVGNRILSRHHNAVAGLRLSDWHCSYRAYRVDALKDIPFSRNSNGFDFDTEVILQLHEAGKSIVEVPIPSSYGHQIGQINGWRYARDVVTDVTRYRLHKLGLGSGELAFANGAYELKLTDTSSHGVLLSWLAEHVPADVLDVGCSDGRVSERVRALGHRVVGVDVVEHGGVTERVDEFVIADLNVGLPPTDRSFDVIVLADVLEHVIDPHRLLVGLIDRLSVGGAFFVSVPNFAHWYPRLKVATGRFGYERRGVFDAGHLRFFTRRSFEKMADDAGLVIVRRDVVGMPLEVLERGGQRRPRLRQSLGVIDRSGVAAWPTMFGYQFLYELAPKSTTGKATQRR